jgi:competence protein ComGC
MIKNKNILIGVIALTLAASTGAVAFAATGSTDTKSANGGPAVMAELSDEQKDAVRQARDDSMEEAVAGLVENGTITQELADKLAEMKRPPMDKRDIDTLTQEQRTALHEAEAAEFKTQLAALVADGTITQDQVDQMEQGRKMMKGLDLTDDQKDSVMLAREKAEKTAVASLVKEGTLTQTEADAIQSRLTAKPDGPSPKPGGDRPASILTDEQETALGDAIKAEFKSKLSDLISEGTITQDQADVFLNFTGGPREGFGGGHGHDPHPDSSSDEQ